MPFKPVDTAIKIIVGPAIDDTDFKTREQALDYNQAGMEVDVILEKHDGTIVHTAVTPALAGNYVWDHTDQGYYSLHLPASGGASFNNTEEGIITVAVYCTGVLPFRSVSYDVVPALVYASMIKGTDALQVDAIQISGDATAANNAELAFDGTGYGFTGCTMPTVTTLTGHTAQTGDNFARIGATGSALTSLAQASVCTDARLAELAAANLPSDIDDLLSRLSAARAGYLDNLSAGAVAQAATALLNTTWTDAKAGYLNHSVATIDTNVDDLLTRITAARAGYLDELEAANLPSDIDDLLTRLSAARAGYLDELAAANIPADIDTLKTNVPDVISLANIRTQADNALIAVNLDHLMKIAVDTNWATTVHLDSALGHMVDVGGAATFDRTTDSNEAIRNRGDAAWTTGAGGTVPTLLQNTTIATLASQTSFTLTAGSADDDAYNNAIIVITDSVTAEQKAVGWVSNYVGATKTVTLTTDPAIFTMAVGDIVDIIATDYAIANIWGTVSSIFTQVGIDGAGLTNMPWNGSWDAEVQSEVNDALVAFFTSAAELVDNIWDEVLTGATHNVSTSAGRRLRELAGVTVYANSATAGTINTITLGAGASATDKIYNRNHIVIVGGTGIGQTRAIVEYNGTTKVASVQRDWVTIPDATSEFIIIGYDQADCAQHGFATAGALGSITLETNASAIDDYYKDQDVKITSGLGTEQIRLITAYNGTTKVATVSPNWKTAPDATSIYHVTYNTRCAVESLATQAQQDVNDQVDTALSDIHLNDLIQLALTVNDGAPNAADFITSSAVAIDDWYNQNMLLFTSGALAGLARFIDDYDGATKRIYLTDAFPQAPANTDAFVIVGVSGPVLTTAAVADAVWDELESGHTIAGSFGEEVTKQGKKLDRNLILDL